MDGLKFYDKYEYKANSPCGVSVLKRDKIKCWDRLMIRSETGLNYPGVLEMYKIT